MNTRHLLALLLTSALLTGCFDPPPEGIAGENYIALDGSPVAEGSPLEQSVSTPEPTRKKIPSPPEDVVTARDLRPTHDNN